MTTDYESTTTPPARPHLNLAAPVPAGDCLLCLGREPLRYVSIPHAALSEKLDELDLVSGDASIFRDARAHLASMMRIGWLEDTYQIGDVTVRPDPKRTGWPWRCTCGDAPCWHAAFCEVLELVCEQQAEANDTALVA
ncbi:MAG TPA: hypothetical protein VFS21_30075 [Roseiflexaceae bacterium]|nr:hypothetical protein [Roseiflexaceae bacterium]